MNILTSQLPHGTAIPRFGIGTWRMGERASAAQAEIAVIKAAIERGVTLIDTAEMYGDGGAEQVIGRAIVDTPGVRERLYLVSKVYPHNGSRKGAVAACERSLKRLGCDYLDCYLLHWPGEHPVAETVDAFETLKAQGKIRAWGVSNFDVAEMEELVSVANGRNVATNQVLYNLSRRGVEFDLLPWQRERGIPTMAYSPIEQAQLLASSKLKAIALAIGATPAQLSLACFDAGGTGCCISSTTKTLTFGDVVALLLVTGFANVSWLRHARRRAGCSDRKSPVRHRAGLRAPAGKDR
jgi:diketogulonate reductase-like aldo/keto reductase